VTVADDFSELPSDLEFLKDAQWRHNSPPLPLTLTSEIASKNPRRSSEPPSQRPFTFAESPDRFVLKDKVNELLAWAAVTDDHSNSKIKDLDFYVDSAHYPQPHDYPTLPSRFFDRPPIVSLNRIRDALPEQNFRFETNHTILKRPGGYFWRTNLSAKAVDADFAAVGEGKDREQAESAVAADLLTQIHCQGHLKKWLSALGSTERPGLSGAKANEKARKSTQIDCTRITSHGLTEKRSDAKIHIYNFAAQSLTVPNIIVKRKGDNQYTATIRLDDPKLQTSATANSEETAEIAACIALKSAIEAYRMQSGQEPLRLRRDETLNLDNAGEIIELYEYESRKNLKFVIRKVGSPDATRWSVSTVQGKGFATQAVAMPKYDEARLLARLVAAVKLVSKDPSLLQRYFDLRRSGGIRRLISPVPLQLNSKSNEFLSKSLALATRFQREETTDSEETSVSGRTYPITTLSMSPIRRRKYTHTTVYPMTARNHELKQRQTELQRNSGTHEDQRPLSRFPINTHREEILKMIDENQYSMIIGATGSGKSTLVPQMLLDRAVEEGNGALCNVICTEPRRIVAMSLAHRVARDRQEDIGEVVGYHIGGDCNASGLGGSITFCTPEVVHLQLEHMRDEFLDGVSHLIVDEVHDRNSNTEKLLSSLKIAISRRIEQGLPTPKVIMMSATVYSDLFSSYFGNESGGSFTEVPSITVPGRLFSVENKYLEEIIDDFKEYFLPATLRSILGQSHTQRYISSEMASKYLPPLRQAEEASKTSPSIIDWKSKFELQRDDIAPLFSEQLVAAKIVELLGTTSDGSILVFLPGWGEIRAIEELLQTPLFGNIDFSDSSRYKLVIMHSDDPIASDAALESVSSSRRRIILATNIAESSLTLPDVKYVVDAGKHRKPDWSEDLDVSELQIDWTSKSSMIQRAGRAGRVQPGNYHGLYSRNRASVVPETNSAHLLGLDDLQIMSIRAKLAFPDISTHDFFKECIEPFPVSVVDSAIAELKAANALDKDEKPTNFGVLVARFQYPPSAVRMAILGSLLCCLQPALVLLTMRWRQSIFRTALRRDEGERAQKLRRQYAAGTHSDHIAEVNAFAALQAVFEEEGAPAAARFAQEHFLHFDGFMAAHREVGRLVRLMQRQGLLQGPLAALNARTDSPAVITALAASASGLAAHDSGYRFFTRRGVAGVLAGASLARPPAWRPGSWMPNPLRGSVLAYADLVSLAAARDDAVLCSNSPVSGIAAALFSRALVPSEREGEENILLADGWIPLSCPDVNTARTVLELRRVWDGVVKRVVYSAAGRRAREWKADRAVKLVTRIVVDLLQDGEKASAKFRNRNINSNANKMKTGELSV